MSTEEQQNYRAQISKADGGPILTLARLHDIVDKDKDGNLTSKEMRAALATPWQAQLLGQLITRYESEWFWNKSKWDELDPFLEEEPGKPNPIWEAEKRRIELLSWWESLAGKQGINETGRVWHFYPPCTANNHQQERGFSFTLDVMRAIYLDLGSDRNSDLLEIASELNDHLVFYKLDTPCRRTHFFAQILQETGPHLSTEEGFIYKASSLITMFRHFRQNPENAELHGYATQRGIKPDGSRMKQEDFEAIANGAYGGRADLGNGDFASGDGWRFRGRGLKQLTGRYNYQALTDWHILHETQWPGDNANFVEAPDLLLTMKCATRSAANFWITKKLYQHADAGPEPEVVDEITQVVNKNTNSYPARRENFLRLWRSNILL